MPARRRIRPLSADRAELRRWNGGSKLDAPLWYRGVDHAANDLFVERPGRLDPHGESRRNETPELRQAATVTGEVDQDQADFEGALGSRLLGVTRLVVMSVQQVCSAECSSFSAAATTKSGGVTPCSWAQATFSRLVWQQQ